MRPHISLVLTGLTSDVFRQILIGTLVIYKRPKQGDHVITLIYNQPNTEKGCPEDPYIPKFELLMPNQYILTFPDYADNRGLKLTVSRTHEEYRYEIGFNPQSISSTGAVLNGELIVDVLDEYFASFQKK